MLSHVGRIAEAVSIINQACALEPTNRDVLLLRAEIMQIDKELQDEAALRLCLPHEENQRRGNEAVSPTSRLTTPTAVADEIILSVDALAELLARREQRSCPLDGDCDFLLAATRAMADLAAALGAQTLYKAYVRTSGCVGHCLEHLLSLLRCVGVAGADEIQQSTVFSNGVVVTALTGCLQFVSCVIDEQRSSKQLLLQSKCLPPLKRLAVCCHTSCPELACAALSLMYVCCRDEVSPKLRVSVLGDAALIAAVSRMLSDVSLGGALSWSPSPSATRREDWTHALGIAQECLRILKECAFSEPGKKVLTGPLGATVCSVGAAMAVLVHSREFDSSEVWRKECVPLVDLLVATALGLSQHEDLRPFFAARPPSTTSSLVPLCTSLTGTLVCLSERLSDQRSNCLAILMNASLEQSGEVRKTVVVEGGLRVLLQTLSLGDEERELADSVVLVRAAGLLSRLAVVDEVQLELFKPSNYRLLCRRLAVRAALRTGTAECKGRSEEDPPKWQLDERAHYVRTLASLVSPPAACRAAGLEEAVIESLLAIFPRPRDDCGVFTPEKVTLVPARPESALLLGNAARCLMSYADDQAGGAAALYTRSALIGVEKLVCAMASCTDMRVRKNIAILLAKGCRLPEVREKVTRLRGLQMMVELQDKF